MAYMGEAILTTTVLLGASITMLILGVIVVSQDTTSRLNQRFLGLTSSGSVWVLTNLLFVVVAAQYRLVVALASYAAAAMTALFFVLFCNDVARLKVGRRVGGLYILWGAITAILSAIPGVVGSSVDGHLRIHTVAPGIVTYALFIVLSLIIGLVILAHAATKMRKKERARAQFILSALLIGALFGLTCNLILPMFGIYSFVTLGPLGSLGFSVITTYAIIRHGLFDVKVAAVRTVAYLFSLATLAAFYFGLAYLLSGVLLNKDSANVSLNPINILLALLLAFIFQPLRAFFDRVTDSIFYRDRYDTDTLISEVGQVVTSTDDLHQLLVQVAQTIGGMIKASGCSFVVHREEKSSLQVGTKGHVYLTTHEIAELDAYVGTLGFGALDTTAMVDTPTRHPAIITALSRRRIALILPLRTQTRSLGFLLIDDQKGAGYTKRDIAALETLIDELVIAIQNALSLQEVRDVNTNLEQRVSTATRELRRSNSQLKALDETKDEFISMASHQLRTPLTSIKGYLSMVLEGDVGDITPAQRKLLEEAFNSSERMVHLIGDFLNVSRLQTGKFIIDRSPVDLAQIVGEEVESLMPLVTVHDMSLSYRPPKNIPVLELDGEKIRQVIMNFIDNAVYYSRPKSTIVIKLARTGNEVVLEVHDQGIGVPKEVQKRLFTKFFRAENARKQRPDGTGIGLFLAKKVITAQGGEIIFESHEGKGSVFGFRLPIKH